jgi:hypothetical protein
MDLREIKFGSTASWLLITNIITIAVALIEGWNAGYVLIVYWAQCSIIVFFNSIRIATSKKEMTPGGNKEYIWISNAFTALFYLSAYFAFNATLATFAFWFFIINMLLTSETVITFEGFLQTMPMIAAVSAIFLANHAYSFYKNRDKDREKETLIRLIINPLIRITPIYLSIFMLVPLLFIFGPYAGIISFMVIKTVADVAIHIVEHR